MDVEELFNIFLRHQHTGVYPDAQKIKVLDKTSIISDTLSSQIILISPNGNKYILGVDDDGTLKTIKI